MSLFDQLGQPNMQQSVNSLKANPSAFLKSKGFNVPDGMTDPQTITRYLLQSGQIANNRLQSIMQMFNRR